PSCALSGRPKRARIHSATVRPSQASPAGAGPRTACATCASCSAESRRAARGECVDCRWRLPAAPSAWLALGDLPNPLARIPGALRDVLRQLPRRQQPQDPPPAAFVRLVGRAVPVRELLDAQVGPKMDASCHAIIIQGPSKTWYHMGSKHTK